jgi:hypothetical protein
MSSAVMRRLNRGIGSRHAGNSMEFSDLLDAIAPQPAAAIAEPKAAIADLVMFRVPSRIDDTPASPIEPSIEPVVDPVVESSEEITVVSRFADNGIEDDLLPVRAPSRRRLRH